MADCREATPGATHGMSSGEQNSAGTLRGDIEERPVIPQCKAVPELLLREVETMFLERTEEQ